MLARIPKATGSFIELVNELPNFSDRKNAQLAKALGVSERTIRRWKKGNAPKAARALLWFVSNRSFFDFVNDHEHYAAMAQALIKLRTKQKT